MPYAVKVNFQLKLLCDERYVIWKYINLLRHEEYYLCRSGFFNKCMRFIYTARKNRLGNKVEIKIPPFFCGKGINIHHKCIILNGHIGDNCVFHGRNCVGNNSMGSNGSREIPVLGNNVDVGVGANIIGNIKLADGIRVGANALVNKSFDEPNCVVVGVPAKVIYRE